MVKLNNKGVALIIVLATILAIVILANLIMTMMLSSSRLTHHKVSRIQGYYASLAGVNYAINRLALKTDALWPATGTYVRNICNTNAGCTFSAAVPLPATCHINEPNFPCSVRYVEVTVGAPAGGINSTRRIDARTIYTYSE